MSGKSQRIDYIDVFRSIGIILMIMGHIGFGEKFDYFIHAFHMPMFFVISGFFFKHKSKEEMVFSTMLVKKAKSLLLPYFIFGIGHYLFYVLVNIVEHEEIELSPLLHLFSINTTGLPICGALWFLTALFFTDIIFFLLERFIKNKILLSLIIVAISLVGNISNNIFSFTLPFALSASFVGVALYYLGFLMRHYQEKKFIHYIFNLKWLHTIILGVVTTIFIFINGYINMREGTYSIIPLFWINAIAGTIVILNFSRLIYPFIGDKKVGMWLKGIGKDAIVYVCLNQISIYVITILMDKCFALPTLPTKVIILVLVLCALFIANLIITKTKLKVIIGK